MALQYIAGAAGSALILGLAADGKPSEPNGTAFIEIDTGKLYLRTAGVWVEKLNSSYAVPGGAGIDTANSPNAGEFARFTDADTVEGRTVSELLADIGVEAGATADQTNAEIETAYNAQVAAVTQAEAEAGTLTTIRRWTPERVKQAIAALGGGAGFSATQTIVTLPYPAKHSHVVNVIDAAMGSTNKVVLSLAGVADTQANASDGIDPLGYRAFPKTGSFDLQISFLTPAAGPLVINYARST